jgi:hypothetical protein
MATVDDFDPGDRDAALTMWADRSDGYDPAVNPNDLMGHPENAKIHPRRQEKSMAAVLSRLGWVQDVIVNRTTGRILDGHMRVKLALTENKAVPVKYVRLSEQEEREVLATFDPIGHMSILDTDMYVDLTEAFVDPSPEFTNIFEAINPTKPAKDPATSDRESAAPDDFGDVVYGMVGWSETKVRASGDEIGALTVAHQKYRAANSGSDDGFIEWLLQSHPD